MTADRCPRCDSPDIHGYAVYMDSTGDYACNACRHHWTTHDWAKKKAKKKNEEA